MCCVDFHFQLVYLSTLVKTRILVLKENSSGEEDKMRTNVHIAWSFKLPAVYTRLACMDLGALPYEGPHWIHWTLQELCGLWNSASLWPHLQLRSHHSLSYLVKWLIAQVQSLILRGAFPFPMVFSLHTSVKALPKTQLHLCLNGVWSSLLFMMCNNGSGRHKVCSYYVIKTICVLPIHKRGGRRRKEKKKTWKCRACAVSRKLRLIQLSHKKTKEKCFMNSIIIKCSACLFPTLFANIYWFSNASILKSSRNIFF